ncbi:HU family DNA-binding protein (plasmid) [Candidatus Bealeia paramacronuclearis]|uniref:HU family DNA-binding protein n=1 Tax=Candidatus Bealeia paramacronuclearis TaxID=1921001 RepID=UPI002CF65FE4|nr:HU family DNA-binding protein [Candidatus Bealeia paramacronuclearis]MEB3703279.1 HU family DNA-binding protein [Candidatus Bealeia paramacronuclearis]
MTIHLPDLIEEVAGFFSSGKVSKSLVHIVIEQFLKKTKEHIQAGETVMIKEFLKLEMVTSKSRKARNPRTGELLDIPAKKRLRVKPSKSFVDELNAEV